MKFYAYEEGEGGGVKLEKKGVGVQKVPAL